jgi:hypothetical protein
MRNGVRIETQPSDCFPRTLVILWSHGVRQQEFRAAFWGISFNGDHNRGADENSFIARLRSDESSFLDTVAFAQFSGNDDCPTFTHFDGFHNLSISEYLQFRRSL